MLRWILIKLLHRQYNIWHKQLRSLCFVDYGSISEMKKVREEKEILFDKLNKLSSLEKYI